MKIKLDNTHKRISSHEEKVGELNQSNKIKRTNQRGEHPGTVGNLEKTRFLNREHRRIRTLGQRHRPDFQ